MAKWQQCDMVHKGDKKGVCKSPTVPTTLVNWLGITNAEPLPTRQQEKHAQALSPVPPTIVSLAFCDVPMV